METLVFEKRFVYKGENCFDDIFVCKRGIGAFGYYKDPASVKQIEEDIDELEKKMKENKKRIKCLEEAIRIYNKEFNK